MWSNVSDYFYLHDDYDRAIYYGVKGLPLWRGTRSEADCLNVLAMACLRKGDYVRAADYAKQCYAIDERGGDRDVMSSSLNTIAGIYMAANQPAEAEKYIVQALALADGANNPARRAVLEGMASEVYHSLHNDEQALLHIDAACLLEQRLGRGDRLAVRQVQKASVLNGLGRHEQALILLNDALPKLRAAGDEHNVALALNKLGVALYGLGRRAQAVPVFREAAGTLARLGDLGNEMHARRGLYESLWTINPDSAKIELDHFELLKDSLYRTATAESLARVNAELDNDWLAHDNARKQSTIARQRIWLAASAIIAILLAITVWWWMKRRMRIRIEALQVIIDELKLRAATGDTQPATAQQAGSESRNHIDDAHIEFNADGSDKPEAPAPPADGTQSAMTEAEKAFLAKLVDVVAETLPGGELSIENIASRMATTRGNLNRKVKALTGITTQQFVMQVRLERACQLLTTTDTPIAQVGDECGFDSAVSFSRAFKRKTGLSPSQYRQQQ